MRVSRRRLFAESNGGTGVFFWSKPGPPHFLAPPPDHIPDPPTNPTQADPSPARFARAPLGKERRDTNENENESAATKRKRDRAWSDLGRAPKTGSEHRFAPISPCVSCIFVTIYFSCSKLILLPFYAIKWICLLITFRTPTEQIFESFFGP
jgi:hypothetical protein